MRRHRLAHGLVIEIGVQVGQDRAPRLQPLDPGERVVEREMARVRPVAQRVHDPDVEVGQGRDARGRHAAEVAGIGELAEAKAQRGDKRRFSSGRRNGAATARRRRGSSPQRRFRPWPNAGEILRTTVLM